MDFIKKHQWVILAGLLVVSITVSLLTQSDIMVAAGDMKIELQNGKKMNFEEAFVKLCQTIEKNAEDIAAINEKLNQIVSNKHQEMVYLVNKQYFKVTEKAHDVNKMDLERVINDWHTLPEDYKNDVLIMKYDFIKNYYKKLN